MCLGTCASVPGEWRTGFETHPPSLIHGIWSPSVTGLRKSRQKIMESSSCWKNEQVPLIAVEISLRFPEFSPVFMPLLNNHCWLVTQSIHEISLLTCHPWYFTLDMLLLTYHSLHATLECPAWYVSLHLSLLTCPSWLVTLDMSLLTCNSWHITLD